MYLIKVLSTYVIISTEILCKLVQHLNVNLFLNFHFMIGDIRLCCNVIGVIFDGIDLTINYKTSIGISFVYLSYFIM